MRSVSKQALTHEKPVFQLWPSYQSSALAARTGDVRTSAVDAGGSPALVAASASLRFLSRGDCRRTDAGAPAAPGTPSASVAAPLNGQPPPLLRTCRQTLGRWGVEVVGVWGSEGQGFQGGVQFSGVSAVALGWTTSKAHHSPAVSHGALHSRCLNMRSAALSTVFS